MKADASGENRKSKPKLVSFASALKTKSSSFATRKRIHNEIVWLEKKHLHTYQSMGTNAWVWDIKIQTQAPRVCLVTKALSLTQEGKTFSRAQELAPQDEVCRVLRCVSSS